jgi:hypothetical protein
MDDLISRQAAIDAIRKGYPDAINSDYKDGLRIGTDRAIYHVEQLPSAQPERDIPVKPIWITDSAWGIPSRQAVCPKCDYYLMKVYFIPNDTAYTTHSRKVSYCGNCGQAIDWSEWEDEE